MKNALKNPDDNLRNLLRSRLEGAELPVSDTLCKGVVSRLPVSVTNVQPSWGWKGLLAGAVAAVALTTGVIWLAVENGFQDVVVAQRANEQTGRYSPVQLTVHPNTAGKSSGINTTDGRGPSTQPHDARLHSPGEMPVARTTSGAETVSRTSDPDVSPVEGAVTNTGALAEPERDLLSGFAARMVDAREMRWLFIPQEDRAASYHWDFGDGTTSTSMAGAHSFNEEGTYTISLKVTSRNGKVQTSSQEVVVRIPGSFHLPNVFSPNSDGINDVFDPLEKAVQIDLISEWMIVNAQGQTVYSGDYRGPWDGSDVYGKGCPPGNYRYMIRARDVHGDPVEQTGVVRLVR